MSITIPTKIGDTAPSWTVQAKKQNPQTDIWEIDNLADVTAVKVDMRNVTTGKLKIDQATGEVQDAAQGLLRYNQKAADVDTAGLYLLEFVLARDGKTETKPNDPTNKVYVKISP